MSLLKPIRLYNPFQLPNAGTLPRFIYGTAWKKDQTSTLVSNALQYFSAVDTACQPKHYREDLVGSGVRLYLANNPKVKREDLFLQSKFTSIQGQDPNDTPYDAKSSLEDQIHQSVERSLSNLAYTSDGNSEGESYIDALLLHSPLPTLAETLEAWSVLEFYVSRHRIRHLGISNVPLFTLMDIYERVNIKPSIVQNRFYAGNRWDIGVRRFCAERGIAYQAFWTLTANPELLGSKLVMDLAQVSGVTSEQALYALIMGLGEHVSVLNGTTNKERMKGDWDGVRRVAEWADQKADEWELIVTQFKRQIGEIR